MNVIQKLNLLKENLDKLQKINEDLLENHLAKKDKIESLEKKIKDLKFGIKENAAEIKNLIKEINADT